MDDGWNHNTHYHDLLLRSVPRPCERALDVGCGLGAFARRLAGVAAHVDAIDRDPGVVLRARAHSRDLSNLRFIDIDFLDLKVPIEPYDCISMIATLHHLPFAAACARVTQLLRPGGVFIVLGLSQIRSLVDVAASAVAWPVSLWYRTTRAKAGVSAPLMEPTMSLDEIRRAARKALPGAIVRRQLLFRYSMVWRNPS